MADFDQPVEIVFRSRKRQSCREHALVLRAVGIKCDIGRDMGECTLVVSARDAKRAWEELAAYQAETRVAAQEEAEARAAYDALPATISGWPGALGYAVVLVVVTVLVEREAFGLDWVTAGKTHAGAIRQGDWWRAVTALTLHADFPHLVANLIIGGMIGLFAGQLLGNGLAWASILMAGSIGNIINAWLHEPNHTSVGASTAVFAAIGILAAYAWQHRQRMRVTRFVRWAPLIGGLILLGFLGTGGARTDVLAHVAGFATGLPLGALYGRLGPGFVPSTRMQVVLGVTALGMIIACWMMAIA